MTRLYFGGAEAPTLRNRLLDNGVERVSFNYAAMYERSKTPNLDALVGSDTDIFLYSGASSANRNPEKYTPKEWEEYYEDYVATVQENLERVTLATEFAFDGFGLEGVQRMREEFWHQLPSEVWAPIWMPEEPLGDLAEAYRHVVVPADASNNVDDEEEFARVLRMYSHKFNVSFHVMGSLQDVWPRIGQVRSVVSSAWTASTRHGETFVWDGHTIRRVQNRDKSEGRRKYRHLIEALGCDPKKVEEDDPGEVSKLAIASLLQWEERYRGEEDSVPDTEPRTSTRKKAETTDVQPTTKGGVERKIEGSEGRKVLPVMEVYEKEDDSGATSRDTRSRGDSLRQCNNCPVAGICPEYKPGNDCAYEIPIKIRTKDQLLSVMSAMVEIQGKRAMFSHFVEELEGGSPNKQTSGELERFFNMTEKMKSIAEDRDFMKITIEGGGGNGGGGILSSLFSSRSGEQARELPAPVDSDDIMEAVVED